MSPRSNGWDVEELKSELSSLACACNHHTVLGAERKRGRNAREKGKKGVWGPCNGGHLFSKLKIRTRPEKIFLLLIMRVAVWERQFGCWPEGWDF